MTEDFNPIDKLYKSKLDGYENHQGEAAHWKRVEKRLFWYRNRYLMLGGLVLLLLASGVYFGTLTNQDTEAILAVSDLPSAEEAIHTTDKQTTEHQTVEINIDPEKQIIEHVPAVEEPLLVISDPQLTNQEMPEETIPVKPSIQESIQESTLTPIEKTNVPEEIQITEVPTADDRISEEKPDPGQTEEILLPVVVSEQDIVEETETTEESNVELPQNTKSPMVKPVWFSLSIYGGLAYTDPILKSEPAVSDYVDFRNDHESAGLGWSTGAGLQLHYKNWFVETGFTYVAYTHNRNYNYSYEALDSLNSYYKHDTIWGWVYDPPEMGKPVVIGIDSTWTEVYRDVQVDEKGSNEFRYIEIPLLLGYQWNHNKLSLDISTGISYGFLMSVEARLPDFSDTQKFSNLDKNSDVVNQQMLNYLLFLGVHYKIDSQWGVYAKPYYKRNLQSVFENNYPVEQYFGAFGINFGVQIRF